MIADPPRTLPACTPFGLAGTAPRPPEDEPEGGGVGRVVVASHRGPVQFSRRDGEWITERGGGGLVSAFTGLAPRLEDAVWVCAAISDEDRAAVADRDGKLFTDEEGWQIRMLDLDPEAHTRFYTMIANPLLWFIQHGLWSLSDAPDIGAAEYDAWDHGYVPINDAFAEGILAELDGRHPAAALVQDYHLYLVPALVRSRRPDVSITFFCHIPWPHPEAWMVLPPAWRQAVFQGMLGADIVGFQTEAAAKNFVAGCEQVLSVQVDRDALVVTHQGRKIAARWYPISVDVARLERLAASEAVLEHERELEAARREKLIVRVDRADLSKNILRGFRAYDLVLERRPELSGRVTFLALLQPTRGDVREYVTYLNEINRTVADLNLKHGTADWQPIDLRIVEDLDLAVAAYKQYDVLMVNPVADGMNLVAKEAVLVNTRDGVLLLSETAGAHAELGHLALTVYPFDVEQQASALWDALTMEAPERRSRRDESVTIIRRNNLDRWLDTQLDDATRIRR